MAKMISQLDMVIRTTKGHVIEFIAGEETNVPAMVIEDCMARGCIEVGAEETVEKTVVKQAVDAGDTSREAMIMAAMEEVLVKNERTDFGANGAPKISILKDMSKHDMGAKERDSLWDKVIAISKAG